MGKIINKEKKYKKVNEQYINLDTKYKIRREKYMTEELKEQKVTSQRARKN